jgi:hypothetical protein
MPKTCSCARFGRTSTDTSQIGLCSALADSAWSQGQTPKRRVRPGPLAKCFPQPIEEPRRDLGACGVDHDRLGLRIRAKLNSNAAGGHDRVVVLPLRRIRRAGQRGLLVAPCQGREERIHEFLEAVLARCHEHLADAVLQLVLADPQRVGPELAPDS